MSKITERRKTLEEYPDVMSFNDLCEYLDVSREFGYKILKETDLPRFQILRKYMIIKSALRQWELRSYEKTDKIFQYDLLPPSMKFTEADIEYIARKLKDLTARTDRA
jgi:chloramphenicol O-acetyltransferase